MVENRRNGGGHKGGPGGISQVSYLSFVNSLPIDYETVKIVANIFIAFIGSGVLGLPYAFKRSGLIEGAFVMGIVAYFSMRAMLLLIDCQYKVRNVLQATSSPSINGLVNSTVSDVGNGHTNGIDQRANGSGESLTKIVINKDVKDKNVRQRESVLDEVSPESSGDEGDPFVKVDSNSSFTPTTGKKNQKSFKDSHRNVGVSQEIITYSDVAFAAWGDMGRLIVDSSLICAQVGFCCGYLIFITENLSNYYTSVQKTSWLVFLLPPLFFLTLIPDLRKLAVFSLMAQVSNLMAFAVVFWFDFEHLHLASAMKRKEISLKGFPFFFCVAVYCFEGAGMVLSLEQSVPADRRSHFKKYFVATIGK